MFGGIKASNISIIATGEKWVGYGIRSFSNIIKEAIENAKKELIMTVYIISNFEIVKNIKNALDRGISIEIFIYLPDNTYKTKAYDKIIRLKEEYDYLTINMIINEVLHAKILIVDNRKVIVGSANLTLGGMIKNYELGFLVDDGIIAQKILTMLRKLEAK